MSTGILAGPTPPDPLDDAVYHYPSGPHRAALESLLRGRLPYRPSAPGRSGPANAARRVVVLSVLDTAAFVWALTHGAAWLVPIACAGLVATTLHVLVLARRFRAARRPRPVGRFVPYASISHGIERPPEVTRGRMAHHRRFAPPPSARPVPARRWWMSSCWETPSSSVIIGLVSAVAAVMVHLTVFGG